MRGNVVGGVSHKASLIHVSEGLRVGRCYSVLRRKV
jgi:hypothetical protein